MKLYLLLASTIATLAASMAVPEPQGGPIKPCTSTLTRLAQFNLSPTETVYLSTATSTTSLDCGDCAVLDIRQFGGPGPVRIITATATETLTTTTTTVCSVTPTPY